MSLHIHHVTDDRGGIAAPEWLARAEGVHRQLREHLPQDYAGKMRRVFAQGGRMCVAADGEQVLGVAVYRMHENTAYGWHMYVDDLITDEARRSTGVGHALMEHLQALAKKAGCEFYTLDSGTHRHRAHAFYFRERMAIASYAFRKKL